MDADAGAVAAGVSQGRQPSGGCGAAGAEGVFAGAGQVVHTAGRAASPALREQQFRNEPGQFGGDVKSGTIDDHVEPAVEGDLGETSSTGGSTRLPGSSVRPRACPAVLSGEAGAPHAPMLQRPGGGLSSPA